MFQAPQLSLNVTSIRYADGLRGVAQTVGVMRRLVNEGKIDPTIRSAAVSLIYLTPEKDAGCELAAIFDHVQNRVRYVNDIHGVETISTAAKTLLGKIGDCDDKSILLAALFEAVGYPTRFIVAGYSDANKVEHVYCQVWADNEWIDCDATEPYPMGWMPPDPTCLYIEKV